MSVAPVVLISGGTLPASGIVVSPIPISGIVVKTIRSTNNGHDRNFELDVMDSPKPVSRIRS
jgi:hypothetical protein